ncbi:protein kinase [Novosphingobium sp. PS1R-30]|uniref:Protein kinase n=1 Tax=Novosphingobium anseongense TaxID=3133436 RepID=A0ABU8S1U7_9SPHN
MIMLGRYRIDAKIGEGAMADVYRGHDESIGRAVALKVLKEELARDAELSARFMREARAAGALNHPNIATIYDVGSVDGVAYIAMELVEGQPLDVALQAQGRLPYERVLSLGLQLASALAYAHDAGIVHRDLKPSNILLTSDGRTAKLLDFGVARIERDGADQDLARTQFGQLMGTPRYMSPEQALGNPVDHRSDLFSLGVVLYELTTGKVAFPGTTLATLAIKIAQEQVEPIERSAADCPRGMTFIIDKLLAKKPEHRFASAQVLNEAIAREIAAHGDQAPARRGLPLRVKLLLMTACVTALVLAGSVLSVLARQEATLQRIAIVSGASISDFVTRSSGVMFAENAGLAPEEQDWTTLQAYVASASKDPEIRSMVIADTAGVIRAASETALVGQPLAPALGEAAIAAPRPDQALRVTQAPDRGDGAGLRFVRPVQYAGKRFGSVDIVIKRAALDHAVADTRDMLILLSLVVIGVVATIGYLSGAMVARPLARLTKALDEAADCGFALRISHRRRDEFAVAFDAFNGAAAAIEPRLSSGTMPVEPDVVMTRVAPAQRDAA